jgi:hypothetical protein
MYGQTGAGKTFSMLGSHKYNQEIDTSDNSNNVSTLSSNRNQKSPISKRVSNVKRAVSPINSKHSVHSDVKYRHTR